MSKQEFKEFDKVLVRDDNTNVWEANLYSLPAEDGEFKHKTLGGTLWKQCIPYNETTKHLIGTTESYVGPDELPVFEFGDIVEWGDKERCDGPDKGIVSFVLVDGTCEVLREGGWMSTSTVKCTNLRLIRKGNFNS